MTYSDKVKRIAWISPYSSASAISAMSKNVLKHMNEPYKGVNFEVVLFVNDFGARYNSPVPLVALPEYSHLSELYNTFDAVLMNMGNNVENHGRIFNELRRFPGVVILHDYTYHHLFANYLFSQQDGRKQYANLMSSVYGDDGLDLAIRSKITRVGEERYSPWDSSEVGRYPLFEPICRMASAIVVHSGFFEEKVRASFDGPVKRLFLPYDDEIALSEDDIADWCKSTTAKSPVCIVVLGHINPSKCIENLIRCFHGSTLVNGKAELIIAGGNSAMDYCRSLEVMAKSGPGAERIQFEYNISNHRLRALKNSADIFVNLRHPNTEGASASLVEQLDAGKPVVVFNSGCYAEVPDGTVVHVEVNDDDGLRAALEELIADPAKRVEIGSAGRTWVRQRGEVEYVEGIKDFILENAETIKRRGNFLTPIRIEDVRTVSSEDTGWVEDLKNARITIDNCFNDPQFHGVEPFIKWPADRLRKLVAEILFPPTPTATAKNRLTAALSQVEGMELYEIVSTVRSIADELDKVKADQEYFSAQTERVKNLLCWEIISCFDVSYQVMACYRWILGRACNRWELEQLAGNMRNGVSLSSCILEFVGSPEYNEVWNDNHLDAVVDFAVGRIVRSDVFDIEDFEITTKMKCVDVVGPYHAAFSGMWHDLEPDGVWTKMDTGVLVFKAEDVRGVEMDIEFLVPSVVKHDERSIGYSLRINGTTVHQGAARRDRMHVVRFDFSTVGEDDDYAIVSLSVEKMENLQASYGHPDPRWLGVMLRKCVIVGRKEEDDEADEEEPTLLLTSPSADDLSEDEGAEEAAVEEVAAAETPVETDASEEVAR